MKVLSTLSRALAVSIFCTSLLFGATLGFAADNKLNINTATMAQLEGLKGIGPELAERILDYKKKNGDFKNIQDLTKIKGIGEKKLAMLKDSIMIKQSSKRY
ncbi:MAG: helix-hairpin-helix domain-containing protein [Nitrospirales bacterium]|nr:helix-hairpin-helix domain-containing protein [Nitrospira sp.]MDR4500325.1 helix-hairpin-helix domain-containing protein [Nitrospirales bacterium]